MRIIDPHIHLWNIDRNPYPWLTGTHRQSFFGDYTSICRNYGLAEFDLDVGPIEVVKVVHVQANWDSADPVSETRWLQSLADNDRLGRPHGVVAFVDLSLQNAGAFLEAHLGFPNVRGIRQTLHRAVLDPEAPNYLDSPAWHKNLALLGPHGLSFDMMVFPQQMKQALEIVRKNPDILFVLEHTGCPHPRNEDLMITWEAGLKLLGAEPNAVVKISGVGMFMRNWSASTARDIVLRAIDAFSPPKCMFASNFPVDSLMKGYGDIWRTFSMIVNDFSQNEQHMLFSKNAERYYRI